MTISNSATETTKLLPLAERQATAPTRSRKGLVYRFVLAAGVVLWIALGFFVALCVDNKSHHHDSSSRLDYMSRSAGKSLSILNRHNKDQVQVVPAGCETTLILMNHCEMFGPNVMDDNNNLHCSYLGFERAEFIASLFGSSRGGGGGERWPAPSYLFAHTPDRGDHWNFREWETLHPLAEKMGLDIQLLDNTNPSKPFFTRLQSGSLCGKVSVLVWSGENLAKLANAFGCGHRSGCPLDFPSYDSDQVWQLKYVFSPDPMDETPAVETDLKQHHRKLRHAKFSKRGWNVFGTVSAQNFDPLTFSAMAGDYPNGGTSHGARWQDQEI